MIKHPAAGCTRPEIHAFDQIAEGLKEFPYRPHVEALIAKGLVTERSVKIGTAGNGWTVYQQYPEIPERILRRWRRWKDGQTKREIRPESTTAS